MAGMHDTIETSRLQQNEELFKWGKTRDSGEVDNLKRASIMLE
jgi:hypothetical protein